MAVFRVDLLVEDPEPVFDWLGENVVEDNLVRKIAYQTVRGWYMKVVFKRQEDAETFNQRWGRCLENTGSRSFQIEWTDSSFDHLFHPDG